MRKALSSGWRVSRLERLTNQLPVTIAALGSLPDRREVIDAEGS